MSAVSYTNIYAQARDILTGDSASATPTNGQLTLKAEAAVRFILGKWSCISDGSGGVNLTGTELAAFERAAGYKTVGYFLGTSLGQDYAATITEVKIGPVTEKKGGKSITDLMTDSDDGYAEQLRLIACIGGSVPGPSAMVARSGRWVSRRVAGTGSPVSLTEEAFGPEDEDR